MKENTKLKLSFHGEKCLVKGKIVSKDVLDDLYVFIAYLVGLRETASKYTHYELLEEWSTPIYERIRKNLTKHGFINGDAKANEKNPNVSFWWEVYQLMSSIIYSPNLKTEVVAHHSSALERNNALIDELVEIYKHTNMVCIDRETLDNIIRYCEDKQVYDKLGAYGDFYYKLKQL